MVSGRTKRCQVSVFLHKRASSLPDAPKRAGVWLHIFLVNKALVGAGVCRICWAEWYKRDPQYLDSRSWKSLSRSASCSLLSSSLLLIVAV